MTRSEDSSGHKKSILVSTATQHQVSLVCSMKPRTCFRCCPPSLEDDSSESSLTDEECEDHWAKTRGEAAREGDWELANKTMAFPIMVKTSQ